MASQYVWESFVEAGVPEAALSLFPLTPDPRYEPAGAPPSGTSFEIVYVGSLTVHKGVPLLIDAVRRLPHADMRLVLVGGWGTRGMRRFIQQACARGPADQRRSRRSAAASARRASCASTPPTRTASPTRPPRRSPAACR